jgi:hypothetical protein
MATQRYTVTPHPIETLLTWVKSEEIAIPEIQRPFVWEATKVRNLLDSLYCGYPVGYLIAWRNPDVKLKDGSLSAGKRVLIDGQQRVTALMASLLGRTVVRSAGFVDASLIGSQNALNFAYILYLTLRAQKIPPADIERAVARWFVMSTLTGRYSGSPESTVDYDIRQIHDQGFAVFGAATFAGELSDAYWDTLLPQELNTSSSTSPYRHRHWRGRLRLFRTLRQRHPLTRFARCRVSPLILAHAGRTRLCASDAGGNR